MCDRCDPDALIGDAASVVRARLEIGGYHLHSSTSTSDLEIKAKLRGDIAEEAVRSLAHSANESLSDHASRLVETVQSQVPDNNPDALIDAAARVVLTRIKIGGYDQLRSMDDPELESKLCDDILEEVGRFGHPQRLVNSKHLSDRAGQLLKAIRSRPEQVKEQAAERQAAAMREAAEVEAAKRRCHLAIQATMEAAETIAARRDLDGAYRLVQVAKLALDGDDEAELELAAKYDQKPAEQPRPSAITTEPVHRLDTVHKRS